MLPDSFTWKGYVWYRRDDSGEPMYNGQWGRDNVSAPDGNDYITLRITNAGSNPFGGEMFTVDPGGGQFGYGTYKIVVGTRLDTLPNGVVFGGLFTYEDATLTGDVAVSNNEIDVNETSNWGEGGPVTVSHNYFYNDDGDKASSDDPFFATSDPVTTHVMTWEPGKLTYDSYVGTGTAGTRLKHREVTTNVPVPTGDEFVDINLWIVWGSTNNPAITPATSVIIRDFSFEEYVAPGPPDPVDGNPQFFAMM